MVAKVRNRLRGRGEAALPARPVARALRQRPPGNVLVGGGEEGREGEWARDYIADFRQVKNNDERECL
jgi:hypothetical protein